MHCIVEGLQSSGSRTDITSLDWHVLMRKPPGRKQTKCQHMYEVCLGSFLSSSNSWGREVSGLRAGICCSNCRSKQAGKRPTNDHVCSPFASFLSSRS
ncbi:hypothetical protein PoB_003130100 [Plakobranchus ocellatus]|uniref:Uncharacterized protein n=1 Tax=Plakobranchus ocellatus TaxID=259542 RepID=A0AAV4A0P7_9GAST|nr:hypothetical protein PoB_003130100 [Plakobranchus ocellatus]